MAKFDKINQLWGNLDQNYSKCAENSVGQEILDLLLSHGTKIAQVISKFLNFIEQIGI